MRKFKIMRFVLIIHFPRENSRKFGLCKYFPLESLIYLKEKNKRNSQSQFAWPNNVSSFVSHVPPSQWHRETETETMKSSESCKEMRMKRKKQKAEEEKNVIMLPCRHVFHRVRCYAKVKPTWMMRNGAIQCQRRRNGSLNFPLGETTTRFTTGKPLPNQSARIAMLFIPPPPPSFLSFRVFSLSSRATELKGFRSFLPNGVQTNGTVKRRLGT